MRSDRPMVLVVLALAFLAAGCKEKPPMRQELPEPDESAHLLRVPGGAGPTATSAGMPADGRRLAWKLPADWRPEPPSNRMRLTQAIVPGPGGDGQMALFYFGPGEGGSVDANLDRWADEVAPEAGTKPQRDVFTVGELTVHTLAVAGTLRPTGMGMGPKTSQHDAGLLAAVVEGPGGPWFFKLTAPKATLEAQRDAFLAMLHGLTLQR